MNISLVTLFLNELLELIFFYIQLNGYENSYLELITVFDINHLLAHS